LRVSGTFRYEVFVSSCVYMQHDRQCTYNITQRRVRVTIVAVEKQISIAHSECVFVDLSIKHAMRLIIYGLPRSTTFFPHYLINGTILGAGVGKLLSIKCAFRASLQLPSEMFFILKRMEQDMTGNLYRSSCKVLFILVRY